MLPGVVHRRGEGGVGASEKRELSTGGGTEDQRNQRRLKHQRCRARACVPSKETKWKGWGGVGLYKTLFYFKALLWESVILLSAYPIG